MIANIFTAAALAAVLLSAGCAAPETTQPVSIADRIQPGMDGSELRNLTRVQMHGLGPEEIDLHLYGIIIEEPHVPGVTYLEVQSTLSEVQNVGRPLYFQSRARAEAHRDQRRIEITAARREAYLKEVQARREAWIEANPNQPQSMHQLVREGIIALGMPQSAIQTLKGNPDHINRSVGSYGVHEQWVYGSLSPSYYYFQNGMLTSWQDSR